MKKIILFSLILLIFCGCIDKNQNSIPDFVTFKYGYVEMYDQISDTIYNNDSIEFNFKLIAHFDATGAIFEISDSNTVFIDTLYFIDSLRVIEYYPVNLNIKQDTILCFRISATSIKSQIEYVDNLFLNVKVK